MPDKITYQEFSAKVKEKYPDYKDVDDFELATKMVAKYPDYATTVDLKKKEEPVSFGGSESGGSRSLSSTPDREFREDGQVSTLTAPAKTAKELYADKEKKEMLVGFTAPEEKQKVAKAIDRTNEYFSNIGGSTPYQKMQELNSQLDVLNKKYDSSSFANMTEAELAKVEQDYKQQAAQIASNIGLDVDANGNIRPPKEETELYKSKLADNIAIAESEGRKEQGFFSNLASSLASGYETASGAAIDMLGVASGLNYFDSYRDLSKGNRYNAQALKQQATKYDSTIEEYAKNGDLGKATGVAITGAIESLPYMIPALVNPEYGVYVMGAMSAVDKYRELDEKKIPEWEKAYNAISTGLFEAIFEKVGTGAILSRSKRAMLEMGEKQGREAITNAVKKTVENNISKIGKMPEWVKEGFSEVATGVGQDITDKVTVNPETKIGASAVDNFVVGSVMGKAFALPQDVAKFADRKQARDFATKVLDKLPADMDIESKINLGWKIVERDKLQEAEDKLDPKFKGKYATQLVTLNSEIDKAANEYLGKAKIEEVPTLSVGKMEGQGTEQQKLDYLKSKDVKVPDGTTMEQLNVLYDETKQKEEPKAPVVSEAKVETKKQEPVVVEETKPIEIKPTETVPAAVEEVIPKEAPIVPTKTKEGYMAPKPSKPIEQMSSEEIRSFSDEIKQHEKNIYSVVFGEQADKFKQLEQSSNNITKTKEQLKAIDAEMQQMIDALPKEKRDVWDSEAEYDDAELRDMSRMVGLVEESENINELSSSLKNPLMTFSKNKNNKQTLAIFNAAIKKAQKLGVSTEELIGQTSKLIASEFKDPQDAIDVVKSALEAISQPTVVEQKQLQPTQQKEVVVVHAGSEPITLIDEAKLQSRDQGQYGKGFYVAKSETNQPFYGKVKSYFKIKPESKVLNKDTFDVEDWKKTQIESNGYKYEDVLSDPSKYDVEDILNVKSFNDAVRYDNKGINDYAREKQFDILEVNEDEIVVLNKDAVESQQQKQPIVGEQQIEQPQLNLTQNGKKSSEGFNADETQGRQEELLEKNKKADDLLAEGLSDIADLLGTKLSLTGEQRVKVKDAVRKVAKGMILKGEVKVEQLAIAIKDYFSKAGHDISDELINEALKEEQDAIKVRETTQKGSSQQEVVEGEKGRIHLRDTSKNRVEAGEGEKVKQRGFQTGSMEKRGGVFAEIAKEHPLYYNEKTENQQLKDAADWLDGKDEATIISSVTSTKKTGTIEQRVNRKILVAMYLQDKINKFVAEGKLEEADATHENLIKVTDSLAKEGTEIAQGLQAYAKFQRLTPDAVAWTVNNEIRKQNQSKFPETDLKAIESSEKEIDKMSTDISHEAVESEKLSKVIETIADKNKGSKQEKTNAEKAKEIADKLRKVKSSNWGITLAADPISSIGIGVLDGAVELTAKSIEVTGNIADSISKGIRKIKNSDWYKSLSADQKRKIERLFEVNVKKDIGVDSLSKGQLAKYLKTEIKDLKVSIKDVINKHWTDPNIMGITLSERIVSDLGLSKAEADLVEKTMSEIIRDMLDGKVVDYISGEALPKSKAQKAMFLDKMRDFLMVGKMDEKIYRDIFAQKFGLTPDITKEEVTLITNLNKAVQATKNMGVFGDIVANEFAREIDKLIPKTRLQELFGGMIGLDYANALSGATTHYVNMKSVFFNLLARPLMDVTRLEDWVAAARRGEMSQLPIMNVFNAWSDFAKAMGHGTTDFADIIKSGDLRAMHKYISEVKSIANLNVPELERHAFGKDRFKNIQFKGIDVNAANYMKYVGRALAAEDAFNYRGFEAVELASALRKKMQKQGFTNEQIKEQINKQVYGLGLSEAESKEIETQLAKEKANMASFGFKTDKFKDNRRRLELVREKLLNFDEAELTDLREVAKGNVFNDTRGGIVNSVMATMSRFANKNIFTKLATMPHFMFFRIAGNIGDFSIDTIPAYGTLRAKGYTPTTMFATYMKHRADGMSGEKAAFNAMFGKRLAVSELPWKTAQLGDMGSYRYKQQQDRARIGNLMLLTQVAVVMGLYAIGGDDKDENGEPWFDISGGRFFDKDMYGREAKLMPPYTIKIGGWKWRYGNAPIMTFGMSVLGNYADMVKAGLPEEEISARVKLMSRSFLYSIGALTDQQLMQGFKSMFQSGLDLVKTAGAIKANDESGENKPVKTVTNNFMKYMAKEQLSPLTAWLPSKNNLFQQALQTYTGTAVESKDIPAMLAYDVGIHHFTNNKALDVLGNEVKRKPGYTGIYYEPAMIKENPKAWAMTRWLQENNAYPANYYNRDEKYVYATPKSKGWLKDIFDEKKPSYESKTPSEDEFWQMRKLTGEMISKDLEKYKEAEYNGKKIWKIEADEKSSNGKTVMQEKVAKYVSEAKQQTRLYLFTWKELGRSDPKLFKTLYENKALPAYETKVPVYKRDQSGSLYMDENNEVVIRDKRDLMDESLSSFNADAFKDYFERMKGIKTTNPTELRLLSDIMWKTAVQTKAAMYAGE